MNSKVLGIPLLVVGANRRGQRAPTEVAIPWIGRVAMYAMLTLGAAPSWAAAQSPPPDPPVPTGQSQAENTPPASTQATQESDPSKVDSPAEEGTEPGASTPTAADIALGQRLQDVFGEIRLLAGAEVSVRHGVVQLTGEVTGPRALDAAAEIARGMDGVVWVENLLQVQKVEKLEELENAPEKDAPAAPPDATSTSELETSLRDEAVQSTLTSVFNQVDELSEVRVEVRSGVVLLSGIIDSQEARDQAIGLARSQDGVLFVEDRLETSRNLGRRLLPDVDRFYAGVRNAIAASPLVLVALLIFAAAVWIARRAMGWGLDYRFLSFLSGNALLMNLLRRTLALAVILLGIFMALRVLSLEYVLGAVLGGAGILGVALGFAFRDIIENYLASIILSLRQPFSPKDLVNINDELGTVVRLSPSYTLLMTPDGNHVRIPNADVFKGVVTNYTRNPRRRFDLQVAVGGGEDLSVVAALMTDTLSAMDSVLDSPEPYSVIEQLGDSSVVIRAYGWMDQRDADFAKVRSEAIRMVKARLDEEDVDMPVPTYRVDLTRGRADDDQRDERIRPGRATLSQGDVAVDKSIEHQVDAERSTDAEPDLLDKTPPKTPTAK